MISTYALQARAIKPLQQMNIRIIAKTQDAAGTRFTWHPIYYASRRGRGSKVNIYANANITIYRYVNIQRVRTSVGEEAMAREKREKGAARDSLAHAK